MGDLINKETESLDNVISRMGYIIKHYENTKHSKYPDRDPNMKEFIELCYLMGKYLNKETPHYGIYESDTQTKEEARKRYPVPCAAYDLFMEITKTINERLLRNELGIAMSSPLYKLFLQSWTSAVDYKIYKDTQLLQLLAAVSLKIAQGKRDVKKGKIESFTYNNIEEMNKIEELHNSFIPNKETLLSRYKVLEEIKTYYNYTYKKYSSTYTKTYKI